MEKAKREMRKLWHPTKEEYEKFKQKKEQENGN
jgi:hypothetical protein